MPEKSSLLSIRARIQFALKEYDYTIYRLSSSESERSKLTKQIKGTVTISAETLSVILEAFPNLSAEWLMRGEGTMTRTERKQAGLHQTIHTDGGTANVSGSGDVYAEPLPTADMIPDHALLQRIFKMQQDAISQRDKTIAAQELLIEQLRASK